MNNLEQDYALLVDEKCLKMVEFIENCLSRGSLSDLLEKYLGKFYDIQSSFLKPHLKFDTIKRIQVLE